MPIILAMIAITVRPLSEEREDADRLWKHRRLVAF
jgi:hypothetical protein